MENPVRHAADPFRIDSLLRVTSMKSLGNFNVDANKLSDFDLEQPAVTLRLNDDIILSFGSSTPLDQRRYVLLNNKIHLISDTLYYQLIGSFPTFLRKQLLEDKSDIIALELPALNIEWNEDRWQLSPQSEEFSADQVTTLLDNWKLASALQIKSYDGRQGNKISVTTAKEKIPVEFLLTSRSPDLILARPDVGIQYHLSATSSRTLLALPSLDQASHDEEPMLHHGHEHQH